MTFRNYIWDHEWTRCSALSLIMIPLFSSQSFLLYYTINISFFQESALTPFPISLPYTAPAVCKAIIESYNVTYHCYTCDLPVLYLVPPRSSASASQTFVTARCIYRSRFPDSETNSACPRMALKIQKGQRCEPVLEKPQVTRKDTETSRCSTMY